MPSRDDETANQPRNSQTHAEGQRGDKTRSKFLENLKGQSADADEPGATADGSRDFDEYGLPVPGRHRLSEERRQHDPAENISEANRVGR